MKRELSGKVNRELSGKTLEDLSDDELVEVIVDTVKEQARAVRYEDKIVGRVEEISQTKDGYSITVVITDQEMIKKISGGNECQSIRLSSKMKTDKS